MMLTRVHWGYYGGTVVVREVYICMCVYIYIYIYIYTYIYIHTHTHENYITWHYATQILPCDHVLSDGPLCDWLQTEDAGTQMDQSLMDSIKKDAEEAVLAHLEERLATS